MKYCILFIIVVIIGYAELYKEIKRMSLAIDSNNAILITLRDRAKHKEAEARVEKLKINIKAFQGTKCETCHVGLTKLLLPIDDKHLSYELFLNAVRQGNLYMPSFTYEQISNTELKRIYDILYKEH